MDAFDIFKKLTYGTHFRREKSTQERVRDWKKTTNVNSNNSNVIPPDPKLTNIKTEEDESSELVLLGSITSKINALQDESEEKKLRDEDEAALEQERDWKKTTTVNSSDSNVIPQRPMLTNTETEIDEFSELVLLGSITSNSNGLKFKSEEKKLVDEDEVTLEEQERDWRKTTSVYSNNSNVILQDPKLTCIKTERDESSELVLLGSITSKNIGLKDKSKKKKLGDEEKAALEEKERVRCLRKQHRITALGKDIPEPIVSFTQLIDDYGVSHHLVEQLQECGYEAPTPIQMQAIPLMLKERQIFACAPTGSGKTIAFLLPILHHLKGPRKKGFRAVVVSPTRELAQQTYREFLRFTDRSRLKVHFINNVRRAVDKFGPNSSQKFDILVTTPFRLVYLLNLSPPALSLSNVEWLVIDESDKLFEAGGNGFREQLAVIYKACNAENIKRAMFSATYFPLAAQWARKNIKGLVSVTVGLRNAAAEMVDQELLFVGSEHGKLIALRDLVKKGLSPPVLVFVQTKERAKELFKELIYDGINVDIIHADRTPLQRDNVVRSFREGNIWVLICTELMGRGIDFKGVNLVINYDFPPSAVSYVHRIGRTGRAGRPGKAVTFFTEDDREVLHSIVHVMRNSGCEVPEYLLELKKVKVLPKKDEELAKPRFRRKFTRGGKRTQKRKLKMSNFNEDPLQKKQKILPNKK